MGAIHSAEIGDGTLECEDILSVLNLLGLFLKEDHFLPNMCDQIVLNHKNGIYDGAMRVVKAAFAGKE